MNRFVIAHLVDDTSAGGVTRFLETLSGSAAMAAQAEHRVVPIRRGRIPGPLANADMVVSHLSVSWRTLPSLIGMRARFAGRPFLHVEHSYSGSFEAERVARRERFRLLLRTAYALFDEVVAVSHAQGAWMIGAGLVPESSVTVIQPAVELSPFLALAPSTAPIRRLGAIGRLDPQKGFDLAIEAMKRVTVPGVTLEIVGDGPEKERLIALAGDDCRISFRAHSADPAASMAGMDAVLMPSLWEPYGLVALEARAAGRPLLVSGVDGLQDHAAAGAMPVEHACAADCAAAISAMVTQGTPARVAWGRADAARALSRMEAAWMKLVDDRLGAGDLIAFPAA